MKSSALMKMEIKDKTNKKHKQDTSIEGGTKEEKGSCPDKDKPISKHSTESEVLDQNKIGMQETKERQVVEVEETRNIRKGNRDVLVGLWIHHRSRNRQRNRYVHTTDSLCCQT